MKSAVKLAVLSIFLFLGTDLFAQRNDADTALMKRPRYFGIYVGTIQYTQANHFLFKAPPSPILGVNQIEELTVGNAFQSALFFTYPFLHRMEWDAGFGVFSFKREKKITEVTAISGSYTPQIISSHSWIDHKNLTVTEFKSQFSFELIQQEDYKLLIGAGGWIASQRMAQNFNPGTVGVEANITGYYRYNKKSFMQVHLSPGWMKNGYYINATIGVCYQGERTMRAHPKHYYVRTYDQED